MTFNSTAGTMEFPVSELTTHTQREQFRFYLEQNEEIVNCEFSDDYTTIIVTSNCASVTPQKGVCNEVRAHSVIQNLVVDAMSNVFIYVNSLAG